MQIAKFHQLRWSCRIAVTLGVFLIFSANSVKAQDLKYQQSKNQSTLDEINKQLNINEKKRAALKKEIGLLATDRARISKALIDAAKRSRALELELDDIEIRLLKLQKKQAAIKQSLLARRDVLSRVLAALQRMGRKPPPAILVRPQDALAAVRSAVLLGAVVPQMRTETEQLAADLGELAKLRTNILTQRTIHANRIEALTKDNTRLSLLIDEKLKLEGKSRATLQRQNKVTRDLVDKAISLKQLIAALNARIDDADLAAKQARQSEDIRRSAEDQRLSEARARVASTGDDASAPLQRFKPQFSFSGAKGQLQLPVNGVEVLSFGENNSSGAKSKGVLMATRANAIVTSPLDARIVFAGKFRSYGQLIILDAGEKAHIVLAGMARTNVGSGQFVLAGEPVARMGSRRIASVSAVDMASSRPMLYVEFRKDGKSIDPAPWWAENSIKRSGNDS